MNSVYFKYSGEESPQKAGYLPENVRTAEALIERLLGVFGDWREQNFAVSLKWGETELLATNGFAGDGRDGEGEKITETTRFRLASVTKQLVARCVIELEKCSKISFDDRLTYIFEGLPEIYGEITVEMVLRHTSGLMDYEDMPDDGSRRQVRDGDVLEFLRKTNTLYFKPGTAYRYSNTGYVILGLVIEKASGLSLSEAMKKYVFDPADMSNTMVNVQGETVIPERAYGHERNSGKVCRRDQSRWSAAIGDGGVYSTIRDIIKWQENLVKNESRLSDTMFTDAVLPDGNHTSYGMGIRLRKAGDVRVRTHTGITVGFNSAVVYSPDVPFRAAFLTNLSIDNPSAFIDAAVEVVFGTVCREA